jgi:hypothetical protein
MKVEVLSKTEMRERRNGAIVTRYGCTILRDNQAQSENAERPTDVQITVIGETVGGKRVGDTIEIG